MKVTITLEDHEVPNQLIGAPNPVKIDIVQTKNDYRDDHELSSAFKTADLLAAGLHVLQGPKGEKLAGLTMALYQQMQASLEQQEVTRESPRVPRTRN